MIPNAHYHLSVILTGIGFGLLALPIICLLGAGFARAIKLKGFGFKSNMFVGCFLMFTPTLLVSGALAGTKAIMIIQKAFA